VILDLHDLASWMDEQGLGTGHPIGDVERIGGGTQNILVRFTRAGHIYVLRRPPERKRENSDQVIRREVRVLRALAATDVPHPRLIAACDDTSVLGATFFLMESVSGFNPAQVLPDPYRANRDLRRSLGLSLVDGAAMIGAVDYLGVGLGDLGNTTGYLERQVDRWRAQLESYSAFRGYPGELLTAAIRIGRWLDDHRPASWRPGLTHGDYHLGNVLVAYDRPVLASIVDWELATIGDPLLDLGWLLASWPDPGTESPGLFAIEPWDGFPSAADLINRYAKHSDRDLSSTGWYHILACYKLGILMEGTYARAFAGYASMDTGMDLHDKALTLFRRALAIISS
jgi:aminoglycoside phosphotransferase (APT) family kinase protein